TVSGVLLMGFLLLLAWWIARSGVRRLADGAFVALFAASYCLTFLTHMIGYLEIPSAILALVAIATSNSRLSPVIVLATGIAGVLIHENYLFTFLPLTLLPLILKALGGPQPRRELAYVAVIVAVLGLAVVLEALAPPMSAERVARLQAAMSAAADFQPRDD